MQIRWTIAVLQRTAYPVFFSLPLFTLTAVTAAPVAHTPAVISHRTAPRFSRTDLNGKTITLSRYRGSVVLLNFWATWCGPCLIEMPVFASWQQRYAPQQFQVIGVSMDNTATGVKATVKKLNVKYPVLMGDASLGTAYGGILGLPVTFLIDRRGRIVHRYEGAEDLKQMEADLQSVLKAH